MEKKSAESLVHTYSAVTLSLTLEHAHLSKRETEQSKETFLLRTDAIVHRIILDEASWTVILEL